MRRPVGSTRVTLFPTASAIHSAPSPDTVNSDGSFSYLGNSNYNGSDSFVYQANDGHGGTDTATVTISVQPVNDPPSFTLGSNQTVKETDGKRWAGTLELPGVKLPPPKKDR